MPTKIEWCHETINPLGQGCYGPGGTKENPNVCTYCYARRLAHRGMRGCELCKQFIPHTHFEQLEKLKQWKKPRKIFVQSMGDLFHDEIPGEWIDEVLQRCLEYSNHTYMFLTKNPKRYNDAIEMTACEERSFALSEGYWNKFWFGTTITCQNDVEIVKNLSKFSEGHKFLSIEPLLSEVKIDLSEHCCPECNSIYVYQDNPVTTQKGALPFYCEDCGWEGENPKPLIEFVIIGQQTGPGAVPPKDEWVQSIIEQCKAAGVPIFIKHPLYEKFLIQEWPKGLVNDNG